MKQQCEALQRQKNEMIRRHPSAQTSCGLSEYVTRVSDRGVSLPSNTRSLWNEQFEPVCQVAAEMVETMLPEPQQGAIEDGRNCREPEAPEALQNAAEIIRAPPKLRHERASANVSTGNSLMHSCVVQTGHMSTRLQKYVPFDEH